MILCIGKLSLTNVISNLNITKFDIKVFTFISNLVILFKILEIIVFFSFIKNIT
ncbi:hypothetical protein BBUCA112A_KI0044 (plasmid) [Borreliella burgdorferi CA-11.2A]|nr:hypothetical protein BBU72A_I0006 [Borreliella burgdorferi 72a]ACN56191.1 hypothetical protein BBUCA112A_KI0044 [Borreliella burgdorferi CA-11.2A]ACN92088.1 hypothetical protein BBU94A_I02 [Borreliella burgdorferi 94a]